IIPNRNRYLIFADSSLIPMTKNRRFLFTILFFLYGTSVSAEPALRYIFFLHNKFIEVEGLNGIHPEYGHCEYQQIINGFSSGGFTVISEVRPMNTDALLYARKIVRQVDSLLNRGVNPSDITIIG